MSLPEICIPPTPGRDCGRPTKKDGRPCRQHANGYLPGCSRHATPDEVALAELLSKVAGEAYIEGFRTAQRAAGTQVESLSEKVRLLEYGGVSGPARLFYCAGQQLVEVGETAYTWSGSRPLVPGDAVLIPRTRGRRGLFEGVVSRLGTTQSGPFPHIATRAPSERLKRASGNSFG